MEVGSGEKEKEVALKHSECEEDLNLVSSSRVSQFFQCRALTITLKSNFYSIILFDEETILCQTTQCINVCVCSGGKYCTFTFLLLHSSK